MNIIPPGSNENPFLILDQIAAQADASVVKFEQNLQTLHLENSDPIPQWIVEHIRLTRDLQTAVNFYRIDYEAPLPKAIVEKLENCTNAIKKLARRIDTAKFLECLQIGEQFADDNNLLKPLSFQRQNIVGEAIPALNPISVPPTQQEWSLNLGLLMSVYQRTQNPDLKRLISIMAVNYLSKISPIIFTEMNLNPSVIEALENSFQHGVLTRTMTYNRENPVFDRYFRDSIKKTLARASGDSFLLTDSINFEHLLPLMFTIISTSSAKECADSLTVALSKHLRAFGHDSLSHYIQGPLLLDLTAQLQRYIHTSNQKSRDDEYEQNQNQIEGQIKESINQAVAALKSQYPDIIRNQADEQRLAVFIKTNMLCICRTELNGVGIIKFLPLQMRKEEYQTPPGTKMLNIENKSSDGMAHALLSKKYMHSYGELSDFLNLTGLRLGSLRGKAALFNFITLEELIKQEHAVPVEYAGIGENALYFKTKSSFTEKKVLKEFTSFCTQEAPNPDNAHRTVLGKCTINLLQGLLKEISEEQWKHLNVRWETRMLFQTILYRILQHFAKANTNRNDFGKVAQCMELVQYEIASLLLLIAPFKENDFDAIYEQRLQAVPPDLHKFIHPGVGKSAMNVLSGLMSAAMRSSPNLVLACDTSSHFESVEFIGTDKSIEKVIADKTYDHVDLYLGEFNYNVNLDPEHVHYTQGNIIHAVENLLRAKRGTKHLTVAVDCTIDYVNSSRVKQMLTHFAKEIEAGLLNFVIFRSGQKFDIMGFDNYYGAPFYMVNNGGPQWKHFNHLKNHPSHKTDLQSLQWFCLLNKYAPEVMDDYRRIIFENTKRILNAVPESLKTGKNPHIKVATVEQGVDTCFIDIKLRKKGMMSLLAKIENIIFNKFAQRGAKVHSRGGYGFYHPNVSFMKRGRADYDEFTVRINPGLSAQETSLIIEALNDIASLNVGEAEK